MKKGLIILIVVVVLVLILSSATKLYNRFVSEEEKVKTAWAQVENVYQRRLDLIPNLVETVKGYAKHEEEVLVGVTEARAKMGGMINIGSEVLNDPAKMAQFQQAQSSLSSALQRLMMVVEQYPQLKADQNFRDLQVQLEGTENRIATERRRFNQVVQEYNTLVRRFPGSLIASLTGFAVKSYFQAELGAEKAPQVKF
ncbi:LemA family protein [candidate division KSB1 bacterium]|nr:LemA family protein [candidate division KSB1 bacterium]